MRSAFFIFLSVFFALAYSVLPVPEGSVLSIDMVVLLLLVWSFITPKHPPSIFFAWCLGLLQDLLLGSMLGEHALSLSLTVFMLLKLLQRMRFFALWQQVFCVGGLSLINQLIIALFQGASGHFASVFVVIAPAIMGMFCWIIIYLLIFYRSDNGRLV